MVLDERDSLLHELAERLAPSQEIFYEPSDISESSLQFSELFEASGRLHFLNGMYLLWVKTDPFVWVDKSKELSTSSPLERFCKILLQLMCLHEVKHLLMISQVVAFDTTHDCNVIYVELPYRTELLLDYFVHGPLVGDACILETKE